MEVTTKRPWQSKTFWFNLFLAFSPVLYYFFPKSEEFVNIDNIKSALEFLAASGLLNIILRLFTKTEIKVFSEKEKEQINS